MTLHEIILGEMEPVLGERIQEYVAENLEEFRSVLDGHPVDDNIGAVSICEAFWLYCLVRDLEPKIVIESGTLYGFSLYFLRRAAPDAEMHSFDPLYDPAVKLTGVQYHKTDWQECFHPNAPLVGTDCFVFFDDHQDQDQRLRQSLDRSVSNIVFHDNYATLGHSHKPIRFCALDSKVRSCYTFDCLRDDQMFQVGKNAQTYRWLTWLSLVDPVSS